MNKILLMIMLLCTTFTICKREGFLPADCRIFKDTPVWNLVKAVRANDTKKIEEIMKSDSVDINYQENCYGYTVLMWALLNRKRSIYFYNVNLNTIKCLLDLGADPNIYGDKINQRGENAIIVASEQNYTEAMELLLQYGGNPNSQARKESDYPNHDTALIRNIISHRSDNDFSCMKLLIKYGADINMECEGVVGGALGAALTYFEPKKAYFLLINGADYNQDFEVINGHYFKEKFKILKVLRTMLVELDSEDYIYKRKIIDFLKERGLDYDKEAIPEYVIEYAKKEYPDSWSEYLEKY